MPARPSVVCTECHRLKIGCNKALPCDQCTFHHRSCEYQRPTAPPIDNDVLQERVLYIEQYHERERQKFLVPKQRTHDFDSRPPSQTPSDAARQDALLAVCPSDVFRIITKVLPLSPERASSIQSAHGATRPPMPLSLLPDHYYYIKRDGDPCVTPTLLSLLPSLDEQAVLLDILKGVFIFQPLGSYDELVRRVNDFRNDASAVQETNGSPGLNRLGLYAIAAGALALATITGPHLVVSTAQAINLYTAGRRALQLVIDHPQSSLNSVDYLWSGMLLLQFLLYAHRLRGGEQPHSGAWHRAWVQAEISVVLRMVAHACGEQEANQSLQQTVPQDVHSNGIQERAKLASAAYYYEMHLSDVFNTPSLLPLDPPFSQTRFDSDAPFLATRTALVKLIKASRYRLKAATNLRSAIDVVVSRSNAIKTFLTTMPTFLTLDVEDVGRIENVETAVQKIELVLEAWAGIVRLWRHLLAVEAGLATAAPSTPSDTLSPASSPHSSGSPSASNESFSRCVVTRATRPCIDLITLLHVQFEILISQPRYHFYLYSQAVPRRAFDCGIVLARIISLCDEEQDHTSAAQAVEALRRAIDLLEHAARWFREQSGETVVEEAETLKLLRMFLTRTNNRAELLDANSAGSKRSREAMEGMSDISAARLGDLHGLHLPFTPDMLIIDPVHPSRSPSTTQQTGRQSTFSRHLVESPAWSDLSSSAPSPPSTSLSNSIDMNIVPEPSPTCSMADDPGPRQKKPTPVRPFGRSSPPVLNEGSHGENREVGRIPTAKLRKIQPKGTIPPAGESNPRASQATRGVTMNLDQLPLVSFNDQNVCSNEHHHLQASQQRPVNSAFTSSPGGPSHGGMTLNPSTPMFWMGHPWYGNPALTPAGVTEAHEHLHMNPWALPMMTGTPTVGVVSYPAEPYTSIRMSPVSISPMASAPPAHAPMGENPVVPCTYAPYPHTVSTTAVASEASPTHSHFSSSYGPSPLHPSAPLHNEPTPDSIPQPSPRAPIPQHPQQMSWHYDTNYVPHS